MANSRKSRIAERTDGRRQKTRQEGDPGLDPAGAVTSPLEAGVEKALRDAIPVPGARVCVALSGGVDSMVLLEIVHRLRSRLAITPFAMHVHHGLSPHADDWALMCEAACRARGMDMDLRRVVVQRDAGDGLEAQARELRYACFRQARADVVLLAHHLDDQCETFLLRLLRGSGLHGLLAMPAGRSLGPEHGALLLRPLLDFTREQVVAYAAARALRWIEDESNDDLLLTRNYLRAEVVPRIAARFPAYRAAIGRALHSLSDAAEIVDRQTREDLDLVETNHMLRVSALAKLGDARALNVLRAYVAARGCRAPARAHLSEAWRQLRDAAPGARVRVRVDRGAFYRYRGRIHWAKQEASLAQMAQTVWHGESVLALSGLGVLCFHRVSGEGLRAEAMTPGQVVVCPAQGSMRLKGDERRPSRTLKNLFQEASVPPWVRACTPALRAGGETLWVAGLGYDCRYLAGPGEPGLKVEWVSAQEVE